MNEGVITNGWPFVWAAYAVTALILTGYATSVLLRYRSARAKSAQVKP
jgi:heme exporter protein CcmD